MDLELDKWIVCWTPAFIEKGSDRLEPGAIIIDRLGSDSYDDPRFMLTGGCCYTDRRHMSHKQKIMMMFIDFHTCVVRDGVDPQKAHREFLKIREYRRRISRDIEGAE